MTLGERMSVFRTKEGILQKELAYNIGEKLKKSYNIFKDDEEKNAVISILYDFIDSQIKPFYQLQQNTINNSFYGQTDKIILLAKWFNREICKSERLMIKLDEFINQNNEMVKQFKNQIEPINHQVNTKIRRVAFMLLFYFLF